MATREPVYEVTMHLPRAISGRLDALAERGMALRREMGLFGHVGLRDVLAQALEVGLDVMEQSITKAETQTRRVLTPKEWAANLGAAPRRGGVTVP